MQWNIHIKQNTGYPPLRILSIIGCFSNFGSLMFHQQKPTDHYIFKIICSKMCLSANVCWKYRDGPKTSVFLNTRNIAISSFPRGLGPVEPACIVQICVNSQVFVNALYSNLYLFAYNIHTICFCEGKKLSFISQEYEFELCQEYGNQFLFKKNNKYLVYQARNIC